MAATFCSARACSRDDPASSAGSEASATKGTGSGAGAGAGTGAELDVRLDASDSSLVSTWVPLVVVVMALNVVWTHFHTRLAMARTTRGAITATIKRMVIMCLVLKT